MFRDNYKEHLAINKYKCDGNEDVNLTKSISLLKATETPIRCNFKKIEFEIDNKTIVNTMNDGEKTQDSMEYCL